MMAAAGKFRLDLEALGSSAARVTGQGEDLATAHLSADNRLVAAQSDWLGCSAAALNAKATEWLETSRRLMMSIGDHATDLNQDGIDFAAVEREHAQRLRALIGPADGWTGQRGCDEWR
jgi:uncharacterized protein YukE